jgi:UDP-N-acetylmuramoyl-tripeptide--D-alanyl-D-alanine ligase
MQDVPADAAYQGEEVLGQWMAQGTGQLLRVRFPDGASVDMALRGVGSHFAHNALASCASAYAAGIAPSVMRDALNAFEPVRGRGEKRALVGGGLLIDDSYNANPDSVRAAIEAIVLLPAPRALVLGDMGEVGDEGEAFHQEILRFAQQKAIDGIWLHGHAFADACHATGIGVHHTEMASLIAELRRWVSDQQARSHRPSLWVKGSRFMKMERIVQALALEAGEVATCC